MSLCPLLHPNIVSENGNKEDCSEDCSGICSIIGQQKLSCGVVVRYILESKLKDNVAQDGHIRSSLFSVNRKCPKKLSVVKKTENIVQDLKNGQPDGGKIVGYTELNIEKINQLEEKLEVIQDNYKYAGEKYLDFNNHCSLCSFSGKNLKDLQKKLKIHSDLAKIAGAFISIDCQD